MGGYALILRERGRKGKRACSIRSSTRGGAAYQQSAEAAGRRRQMRPAVHCTLRAQCDCDCDCDCTVFPTA